MTEALSVMGYSWLTIPVWRAGRDYWLAGVICCWNRLVRAEWAGCGAAGISCLTVMWP